MSAERGPFLHFQPPGISYYRKGVRALWRGARGAERFLLTYRGGTHNDVCPFHPPTAEQCANLGDYLAFSGRSLDTARVRRPPPRRRRPHPTDPSPARRALHSNPELSSLDPPPRASLALASSCQVRDLNKLFIGSFLAHALRGDAAAREVLLSPLTCAAAPFDAQMPEAKQRDKWPYNMRDPNDTGAFGFALEHAARGEDGAPEPPQWLYRWEY